MANRLSQLDSSQHQNHVAKIRRNTYFKICKTLLLTIAFVSALSISSIHCASFGHRSVDQQQQQQWQHNQPEYQVYSGEWPRDGATNLDDIINYQPYAGKSQPPPIDLDDLEQSLKNSYSTSLSSSSSSSSPSLSEEEDVDQLYRQLLLARKLFKDQLASQTSSNNNDDELSSSEYKTKLLEQLLEEKLSPSGQNIYNYDLKYDNPKNPLYLLPDQSTYDNNNNNNNNNNGEEDQMNDKITLSLQQDESKDSSDGQGKVTYSMSIEDNNHDDVTKSSSNQQRNLTTLLEDELITTATEASARHENGNDTTTTTAPVSGDANSLTTPEAKASQPSYGSIVTKGSDKEFKLHHDKSSMSSMFSRLYDKLASYLPNFMNFSRKSSDTTNSNNHHQSNKSVNHTNDVSSSQKSTITGRIDDNNSTTSENENDNKPIEASKTKTDSESQAEVGANLLSSKLASARSNEDDNLDIDKMGVWNLVDGNDSADSGSGIDLANDDVTANKQGSPMTSTTTTTTNKLTSGESQTEDDSNRAATATRSQAHNKGHKVSLLRQSSLVMPIKSNDELIIQTDSSVTHPESLLGKYIYAPEHHYHLNTMASPSPHKQLSNSKRVDIDDEQQMYTQMSQRSYMRHLHPGDSVYSSYSGFPNPLYSMDSQGPHQVVGGGGGLNGNKTNDVYFLAMVGSFCAMAMAVVLAAGLFAYRVQQNRKATSETDYPTYGVVGPNSMNGKCGAASFVGGYFGSAGPGSSSTCGSSKTGSVKQLADLYCGDSGVASGNGSSKAKNNKATGEQNNTSNNNNNNNSNNFMANQNAARMYHYQHQKQQMIISDRNSAGRHASASDLDSEDENDDGTYTVYECPGLASAHEMEIKNPLFNDDQSP